MFVRKRVDVGVGGSWRELSEAQPSKRPTAVGLGMNLLFGGRRSSSFHVTINAYDVKTIWGSCAHPFLNLTTVLNHLEPFYPPHCSFVMRVLLLGGTGFLGRRCIQTLLAHQHVLTLHVRNLEKLRSLVSSEVLDAINSVVVGDAVDTAQIARTLRDNNIEAVVDIAGEHVAPWKEPVFPKIAKAVCDAAVTVGKERGRSLRLWVVVGMSVLEYPGTSYLLDD